MGETHEISLRERIRLNLLSAMEKSGINQVQLADKLGISKGTVNNWARGNNSPDVDMVPQICKVLEISILDLYSPTKLESQELASKKSPSATETAPGEDVSQVFDYLCNGLEAMGLIGEGEDISDRQADVLLGICAILRATFDNPQ